MPKVSIVIPCFNQGEYLLEAVESALSQSYQDVEVIIVNDGSTDPLTIAVFTDVCDPRTRIIHTTNGGLASARNTGISVALGEFILPLDADDRIGAGYVEKAVGILEADPEAGIVYCNAEVFGEHCGEWALPEYSLPKLLLDNMIFCSSFFRRCDWVRVGGYNIRMKYGWEDWDFWLSVMALGRRVEKIPETLFFYRVREASMTSSMTYPQKLLMYIRLLMNHRKLYLENYATVCQGVLRKVAALRHG